MTQIAGEAPFEAEQRRKEEQRVEAVRMKRSGAVPVRREPAKLSEDEQIVQQITMELDDRRKHLEEMKEIGISKQEESRLRTEISRKLEELKRYENK